MAQPTAQPLLPLPLAGAFDDCAAGESPAEAGSAHCSEDDHALLRLVLAGGSAAARRALLDAHPSPGRALAAGPRAWRAARLDARQAAVLRADAGTVEGEAHGRAWLAMPGHRIIGWSHPDYPPLLRAIASPPLALFVDGDATALWRPAIAVVGSRAATTAGRDLAREFGHAFAGAGLAVVSGLASGIDGAAHHGALEASHGPTVAVLGCGPDVAYPPAHRPLMQRIAASGLVCSEHPPGTAPRTSFFPSRNRILAGLALGTVVVEAHARSGALITARMAADAGREVFALPGSVRNPAVRGCHRLIRDGAILVETAAEVLDLLAPALARHSASLLATLGALPGAAPGTGPEPSGGDSVPPNPDHHRLWQALGHDPIPMDALVERTGLTPAELGSMLVAMELEGRVSTEHGRYSRRASLA